MAVNEIGESTPKQNLHVLKTKSGINRFNSKFSKRKNLSLCDFQSEAKKAARNSGCKFLFEFPAILIDHDAESAAAILCPDESGFAIVFLAFNEKNREINVIDGDNAPSHLLDFAHSFAQVLAYLPKVSTKHIQ